MRLSINGWPPLASHLLCFFLGMVVLHLADTKPKRLAPASFKRGDLTLALPARLAEGLGRNDSHIYLVTKASRRGECRLHDKALSLARDGGKVYVMFKTLSQNAVSTIQAIAQKLPLRAVSGGLASSLPLCAKKEKVFYGG